MQKHRGLVLKSFMPMKHKLSIFDENFGKIEGMFRLKTACMYSAGTFIEYLPIAHGDFYLLTNLGMHWFPFNIAYIDLIFLHQVLELCYYLIPYNCAMSTIFELILFLTTAKELIQSKAQKKFFLLKIFWQTGMVNEEILYYDQHISAILSLPVELMLEKSVYCSLDRIDKVLHLCMQSISSEKNFKIQ